MCVGLFPWLCEMKSAEQTAAIQENYRARRARQQQAYLTVFLRQYVQALKALYVSLSHLFPSSLLTTLCLSNNRIRRLPRRSSTFPLHPMKTALVLVAAAATLSCTLAFVPPAPVVSRQRSAVRYVHMCGGGRDGGMEECWGEMLGTRPREDD